MNPNAIRNTLINSDYPLDKVIYQREGTISTSAGGFQMLNIPHQLPFIPLPMCNWTTSSSWEVAYEEETGPIAPPNSYSPFLYGFDVTADATNINITLTNYISSSSVTVYFRIYCFEPSNLTSDLAFTTIAADNFILNSEYNYTKLIGSGILSFPDTFGSPVTQSVVHNLGHKPQVVYWVERSGTIQRIVQASPNSSMVGCRVNDDTADFISRDALATNLHWRMYGDE